LQNSDLPPNPEEIAKWEAEFNELMNTQRQEGEWDYATAMQNAWEESGADSNDTFARNLKFDQEGLPILDPYVFGLFPLY
jgi:peroxin-5